MPVRKPVVAGQFYEGTAEDCRNFIEKMLPAKPLALELPARIVSAVVPHAGWMFSGDLASLAFAAIKQQQAVDTFIIFGAVHTVMAHYGMMYDAGQWETPLGVIDQNVHRTVCDARGRVDKPSAVDEGAVNAGKSREADGTHKKGEVFDRVSMR